MEVELKRHSQINKTIQLEATKQTKTNKLSMGLPVFVLSFASDQSQHSPESL